MQGEEDSDREIRAMVLLTLPYPPLPLLAARIEKDDGRLQDDGVTTSHTLLAKALADCAWRNDAAENRLNWKKYKSDLSMDQLKAALDRAKLDLTARDLTRKERADAERARANLEDELIARRKLKQGKGGSGAPGQAAPAPRCAGHAPIPWGPAGGQSRPTPDRQ